MQIAELKQIKQEAILLKRRISKEDFQPKLGETDWEHSADAEKFFLDLKAEQTEEKIYRRLAERLQTFDQNNVVDFEKLDRQTFLRTFISSVLGLHINTLGQGDRSSQAQSNFKSDLIESYNARDPRPNTRFLWCPILRRFQMPGTITAGHLFPWRHGPDMMMSIFGTDANDELFSAQNGLLITNDIESKLDIGFIAIVPDLDDAATQSDITSWSENEPKNYKLRVLDRSSKFMNEIVEPENTRTWADMDNQKLMFKSDFRPKARYVYFHYCCQVLRLAWKHQQHSRDDAKKIISREVGKPVWATPGPYIRKRMLQAFVEELGHEDYKDLLIGGFEDKSGDTADDDSMLAVITSQVKSTSEDELEGDS